MKKQLIYGFLGVLSLNVSADIFTSAVYGSTTSGPSDGDWLGKVKEDLGDELFEKAKQGYVRQFPNKWKGNDLEEVKKWLQREGKWDVKRSEKEKDIFNKRLADQRRLEFERLSKIKKSEVQNYIKDKEIEQESGQKDEVDKLIEAMERYQDMRDLGRKSVWKDNRDFMGKETKELFSTPWFWSRKTYEEYGAKKIMWQSLKEHFESKTEDQDGSTTGGQKTEEAKDGPQIKNTYKSEKGGPGKGGQRSFFGKKNMDKGKLVKDKNKKKNQGKQLVRTTKDIYRGGETRQRLGRESRREREQKKKKLIESFVKIQKGWFEWFDLTDENEAEEETERLTQEEEDAGEACEVFLERNNGTFESKILIQLENFKKEMDELEDSENPDFIDKERVTREVNDFAEKLEERHGGALKTPRSKFKEMQVELEEVYNKKDFKKYNKMRIKELIKFFEYSLKLVEKEGWESKMEELKEETGRECKRLWVEEETEYDIFNKKIDIVSNKILEISKLDPSLQEDLMKLQENHLILEGGPVSSVRTITTGVPSSGGGGDDDGGGATRGKPKNGGKKTLKKRGRINRRSKKITKKNKKLKKFKKKRI